MKQIKFGVLGLVVIAMIAMFLPYVSEGPISMSFWDIRNVPGGKMAGALKGPTQVYIALVGFLIAGAVSGIAVATKRFARWQGIVALLGFLLALATDGIQSGLSGKGGVSTAIGGKLLFLATLAGIVASLAGIVKPEKRAS